MAKFYQVEITTNAIIQAADEKSAHLLAEREACEIAGDDPYPGVSIVREVKTIKELPHGWDGDCIPYGGDGNANLSMLLPA